MSPLLAPVLAQLVTLQLGDRTEARYSKYVDGRYEGSTTPIVALGVNARRTNLQLAYSPSLTLIPLDHEPRRLYVFHLMSASAAYRLRHTTFSVGGSLGFGTLIFRLLPLQGQQIPVGGVNAAPPNTGTPTTGTPTTGTPTTGTPTTGSTTGTPGTGTPATGTPGTGTPGTGTPATGTPTTGATGTPATGAVPPGDPSQLETSVRYYTGNAALNVAHELSKDTRVGAVAGVTQASGLDAQSRFYYPKLRAWFIGGTAAHTHPLSSKDELVTNASLTKTWSSNDNEAATLNAAETWGHRFDPRTSTSLGAGLNITRFSQPDGLRGFSIYPTVTAAATHVAQLGRGTLTFTAGAFSSPMLDPLLATVDPRVGALGGINYSLKKFSLGGSGSVAVSVAPQSRQASAINAAQAEGHASYLLGKLLLLDTGVRTARQSYGGVTTVPASWAAYVGLTFGYQVELAGGH